MSDTVRREPRYTVSAAAELCASHPQTLRQYERTGLLCPRRSASGVRLYSDEDIAIIRRIQSYTAMGVNLAGVELIFRLVEQVERLEARLAEHESSTRPEREWEQTEELRRRLRRGRGI